MNIASLQKLVDRPKKRLGRGHGSGKVKTSGRGTKGQKARGTVHFGFEGGQLPLVKRMPLLRGKGRNKGRAGKAYVVQVDSLKDMEKSTTVSLANLMKYHMIPEGTTLVKLVGTGKIELAYTVEIPCSKGAKAVIEKAGGHVASQTN
jgi:large subunit ribosomal protein L15